MTGTGESGFQRLGGRAARFAFIRLLRWDREFQKYFDHAGAVSNYPLSALPPLGLARAYSISGQGQGGLQFRICTCPVFAFC